MQVHNTSWLPQVLKGISDLMLDILLENNHITSAFLTPVCHKRNFQCGERPLSSGVTTFCQLSTICTPLKLWSRREGGRHAATARSSDKEWEVGRTWTRVAIDLTGMAVAAG